MSKNTYTNLRHACFPCKISIPEINIDIYLFFFAVGSPPKNTPTSTLKSEVSANPLASMAISVKDLQSVQLRKTEKVGKTMSAPIAGEITYTVLGKWKNKFNFREMLFVYFYYI